MNIGKKYVEYKKDECIIYRKKEHAAMNITKLKSGNYRIRQMYQGKNYSITLDHKPSKKEAMQIISDMLETDVSDLDYNNITFEQGLGEYMRVKSNVLSPSTLRGYTGYANAYSKRFRKMKISNITQLDVQQEINEYALNHSAKSVKNLHGLLSAVLKEFRPRFVLTTKLPKKENKEDYIPTKSDIDRILEKAKDTKYELPLKLALCGMRRSEICAITKFDLDKNNVLHINKSYVLGSDKKWYIQKMNKTDAGTREILLPKDYAKLFRTTIPGTDGRMFTGYPNTIYRNLTKWQNELKIPHFSLHKCRHYYCSLLHEQGISDAMIMELGGWKSDYVMKQVYRHALSDTKMDAMQKAADAISKKA